MFHVAAELVCLVTVYAERKLVTLSVLYYVLAF